VRAVGRPEANVDAPYWRGHIATGFQPVDEIREVVLQVLPVFGDGYAIHPRCAVDAQTVVGLLHPVEVQIVIERREALCGFLTCRFRYPLLYR